MVNVLQTVHAEKFRDVNRRNGLYCRAHKEGGLLGLEMLVYNNVDKEKLHCASEMPPDLPLHWGFPGKLVYNNADKEKFG